MFAGEYNKFNQSLRENLLHFAQFSIMADVVTT